jgi:fructose-bisphosphate aldolase/6-deoxy-5-ketofructose 1-phosphate synthase
MIKVQIPADVAKTAEKNYIENYLAITKDTGKLFLFAGDHKIEHLNKDFYGENIPAEVNDPEHLFKIASKGKIGAFVSHLGLISLYGQDYPDINYIVKVNAKTDIVPAEEMDPFSGQLWTIEDVLDMQKNSGLKIRGVGYTVYLGSEYESEMLSQASHLIYQAHHAGLIAILWMYPRGKSVSKEIDANLTAGAAGVAAALGADFTKLMPPKTPKCLKQAVGAAGKTKIICSGGPKKDPHAFLQEIQHYIQIGGAYGVAVGRNIYQNTLEDAVELTEKIYSLVYTGH